MKRFAHGLVLKKRHKVSSEIPIPIPIYYIYFVIDLLFILLFVIGRSPDPPTSQNAVTSRACSCSSFNLNMFIICDLRDLDTKQKET